MAIQVISFDVGIRNFAYCVVEFDNTWDSHKILSWDKVDLGCAKNDAAGLVDALINLLDDIVSTKIDETKPIFVLIENQMIAVMRNLQTTINVYFKMLNKFDKGNFTVLYVNPRLKLKLIEKFPEYNDVGNQNSKYKQNKMSSVSFVKWLLENKYKDEIALELLNLNKKGDDISDTYIQALAWSAYKRI